MDCVLGFSVETHSYVVKQRINLIIKAEVQSCRESSSYLSSNPTLSIRPVMLIFNHGIFKIVLGMPASYESAYNTS